MIQKNRSRGTLVEAWEGKNIGASITMDLRCTTLLVANVFTNLEALQIL